MNSTTGRELRQKYRGLIGIRSKAPIRNASGLGLVCTPNKKIIRRW
jgi:hypothetical protein